MGVRIRAIWFEIGDVTVSQASWWENFRDDRLESHHPDLRRQQLREWGARWDDTNMHERWLEFDNERDATIFLLRWS